MLLSSLTRDSSRLDQATGRIRRPSAGATGAVESAVLIDTAYDPEKRRTDTEDRAEKKRRAIESTVQTIEGRFAYWHATNQTFIGDQQFDLAFLIDTPEKPFRDLLLRLVDRYPTDWLFPIASQTYRLDLLRRIVRAAAGFPKPVIEAAEKVIVDRDHADRAWFRKDVDRLTRQWFEPAVESLRPVTGQIDDDFCRRLINWQSDPRLFRLIAAFDFNLPDAIKLCEEFGSAPDPALWEIEPGDPKSVRWLEQLKKVSPTKSLLSVAFGLLETPEDGDWFRAALKKYDRVVVVTEKTVTIDPGRSRKVLLTLFDQQFDHPVERDRVTDRRVDPPSHYRFQLLEELMADRFVELYFAVLTTEKYPRADIKAPRLIQLGLSSRHRTPEEWTELIGRLIDQAGTIPDRSQRRQIAEKTAQTIGLIGHRFSSEEQIDIARRLAGWSVGWEMIGGLITQQLIEVTDDRFFHWLIDHDLPTIPESTSDFWQIVRQAKFHCLPNQPDEQNRSPIDRLFRRMVGKSTADESVFKLIDLGAEWEEQLSFLLTQPWFRQQPTQWRSRVPGSRKIFDRLDQMITARPPPKMLGDYEDCVACFNELDERVIVACGHATLCFPCFLRLKVEVCPICRGSLKEVWTITASQTVDRAEKTVST